MNQILLVGIGGFFGTILRHLIAQFSFSSSWLTSTIIVNTAGSLLIGFLFSIPSLKNNESLYLFLITGLLGGFTTYSAFSGETLNLVLRQQFSLAISYVLLTLLGGLSFCFVGFFLGKWINY